MAERFSLDRFSMNLQSLERTYIDKVLALCDYYLQGKPKRYSRHLYDIYRLTPLIEFNDEFAVLVREVREHRSRMRTLAVRTCLQKDTIKKNPALPDSPPAAGRFCDALLLRRSAIPPPGGLFIS